MLTISKVNAPFDHKQAPRIGTIGTIQGLHRSGINPARKCVVVAYPLTTSAIWHGKPVSRAAHTIYVRFLDNNQTGEYSAFWFQPWEV